jgi:hypothetical protein
MSNLQLDIRLEAGGGMVYGFLLALSMEGKFLGDHLHSVLLFLLFFLRDRCMDTV